jgi:hypothetical protein
MKVLVKLFLVYALYMLYLRSLRNHRLFMKVDMSLEINLSLSEKLVISS